MLLVCSLLISTVQGESTWVIQLSVIWADVDKVSSLWVLCTSQICFGFNSFFHKFLRNTNFLDIQAFFNWSRFPQSQVFLKVGDFLVSVENHSIDICHEIYSKHACLPFYLYLFIRSWDIGRVNIYYIASEVLVSLRYSKTNNIDFWDLTALVISTICHDMSSWIISVVIVTSLMPLINYSLNFLSQWVTYSDLALYQRHSIHPLYDSFCFLFHLWYWTDNIVMLHCEWNLAAVVQNKLSTDSQTTFQPCMNLSINRIPSPQATFFL